jgi:putative peptidoglycan lipid II flippase
LNYGTRLATVLMSLGPLAVGTVVLAHASTLIEHHDARGATRVITRYGAVAVGLSTVVVAGLIAISEPALRLIFRGGAFSADELHNIAVLQNISLMQVPVAILLAIGIRLIAAARENRILYGLAAITVACTLAMDALLSRSYGLIGIPIAGILVRLVSVLYVFCKIRYLHVDGIPIHSARGVS